MIEQSEHMTAVEKVKEIIKAMNGLSDEGFINKLNNDPFFRNGFYVFVELFKEAKFD